RIPVKESFDRSVGARIFLTSFMTASSFISILATQHKACHLTPLQFLEAARRLSDRFLLDLESIIHSGVRDKFADLGSIPNHLCNCEKTIPLHAEKSEKIHGISIAL